jgi:hypothetical protein
MGGLLFRSEHSCRAAALAMALLPLVALDLPAAWAEQQMLEISVATFLTDPPEIIRENPNGGAQLMVEVRDLALSDPTTLPPILALLPEANKAQKAAIGAGLAQATKVASRTRPAYANEIQQAVAQADHDEVILAYDAALATGVREQRVAQRVTEGAPSPGATAAGGETSVAQTSTALTQTLEPTITEAPPLTEAPPPTIVAAPTGVSPFVVPTPAVASLPAVVSPPVVSVPVVVPPIAALTETLVPTVATLPTPTVSQSAAVTTLAGVLPLTLSIEPQMSTISASISPSQ